MPLSGNWKALVWLPDGCALPAVPICLPADAAIGKPELPAPPEVIRDAVNEN